MHVLQQDVSVDKSTGSQEMDGLCLDKPYQPKVYLQLSLSSLTILPFIHGTYLELHLSLIYNRGPTLS